MLAPDTFLTQQAQIKATQWWKKPFFVTLMMFLIFIISWSTIVLGKFYSLHSYVFDLGFVMERLWQPYHIISLSFYLYVLFSSGFQFILSPLYFFHSFQLLLLLQVISVGVTVFPIYGIAVSLIGDKRIAVIISGSFLCYFPSAGILWFDVHFQAFFVPLFVFAYYFYLKQRFIFSTILFILSGTVRFPYMVFPFIFAIFEIVSFSRRVRKYSDKEMKANLCVLIVSTIFISFGFYFDLIASNSFPVISTTTPIISRVYPELMTFLMIFGPVLFLPILSPKWFIMSLPFFLLGLYSGSSSYVFPGVFSLQYTSMVVPMVFIGTIVAISRKDNDFSRFRNIIGKTKSVVKKRKKLKITPNGKGIVIVSVVLIILLSGSIFYAPYGPLNQQAEPNYSFTKNVDFNTTSYNALIKIESLIPNNNPYVMFQNDMPEFLPRASPNPDIPFLFSIYISANLTLGEVINNTFPLLVPQADPAKYTNVDYLVAYTESDQFYLQFGPNENTLPNILSLMVESGKYGKLAEGQGFIVLERGYDSSPIIL